MKQIIIDILPLQDIRFNDVGDYQDEVDGVRHIQVADMSDIADEMTAADYELMVAVHEMIESHMLFKRGVKTAVVDAWDATDAGADDPKCPYHREHVKATMVEECLCSLLGIDWLEYDTFIQRCSNGVPE
jgi:hypothetical protein